MIKNVSLSMLAFFSFSLAIATEQEWVMPAQLVNEKQDSIKHIKQEIKAVMLERKFALEFFKKIEGHFQNILKDSYQEAKLNCLRLLNTILESNEFAITFEQVTNEQRDYICDKLVKFNDLLINPSVYPLAKKIDDELLVSGFDDTTAQLFNSFYVVAAIIIGTKMLLEKLEVRIQELNVQLAQE